MSISGPNILRGDALDPRLTDQSIRQLYAELERLKQWTTAMAKPAVVPLTGSGPVTSVAQIKQLIQAGGDHFLNVQQLPGQLAEPQIPYVPIVQALPSANDPQSQNGSLVLLEAPASTYTQYEFDGRVAPGRWIVAPTPPVTPTAAYQLLDHDITLVTVNANTTANQTLMTYTFAAGALNTVGKTIRVTCYGDLDELNGPNVQLELALVNGATVNGMIIWTPNTPGVTKTHLPWMIKAELVTHAVGVGGDMECHGLAQIDPANTNGTIGSPILDHNVSGPNPVDLTLAQTLKIFISFSTASASNVGRQRMMLIELLN